MKTQPQGGKGAVQIVYYRIDFTQQETDYLRSHAPELIFSVSDQGVAKLEKVNDIGMQSIVDSLMNVDDRLPRFYPERVNGRPEAGIYFLKLTWPNYQSTSLNAFSTINPPYAPYQYLQYYNPYMRKLSEFSEITYRAPRYDMLLGAFATNFSGNIGKSFADGWGTKFDFLIYGKKGWGGGFGTTIMYSKGKNTNAGQPLSITQRSHVLTLITGSFAKVLPETKVGQFGLQFEPGFGITDVVSSDNSSSSAPFIGLGFSPGVTVFYMMPLGKGRMSRQYFMPVTYRQYLNFHVAARSLMFNTAAASGTVYELGVSYRLVTRPVANYKLKESSN